MQNIVFWRDRLLDLGKGINSVTEHEQQGIWELDCDYGHDSESENVMTPVGLGTNNYIRNKSVLVRT